LADNIGYRKRFPRAGNTKECLERVVIIDTFNQLPYSFGLVAGWGVLRC
jgi:hypothetical protein